jgi:hypothetical protein
MRVLSSSSTVGSASAANGEMNSRGYTFVAGGILFKHGIICVCGLYAWISFTWAWSPEFVPLLASAPSTLPHSQFVDPHKTTASMQHRITTDYATLKASLRSQLGIRN